MFLQRLFLSVFVAALCCCFSVAPSVYANGDQGFITSVTKNKEGQQIGGHTAAAAANSPEKILADYLHVSANPGAIESGLQSRVVPLVAIGASSTMASWTGQSAMASANIK